jgi:thiol-disulfide isomerase/thioredoxin
MRCSRALVVLLLLTIPQLSFSSENRAKDFTLPSATDNSLIYLSDYSGKVVLINWWRTSCPWSQKESPKLVELYKKYHDKDMVIIGVLRRYRRYGGSGFRVLETLRNHLAGWLE